MSHQKRLIVIQGPTACGKTALAIALAKQLDCSILSADSRQFYREISIGTAKPTKEEQAGIPHYFIDSHSIQIPLNAAQYEQEALQKLEEIYQQSNTAILVGGSGLFIDALCYGLDPLPVNKEIQIKWQEELATNGLNHLQQILFTKDPVYASEVDLGNPHRVIRALEIIEITGKSMKEVRTQKKCNRPFEIIRFVIELPREKLYNRINQRVDEMMERGLLDEVLAVNDFSHLQSLNTVGYKEIFLFFQGEITLDEAVMLIKQNSRRYAKRQLTWFRRDPENLWIGGETTNQRLNQILAACATKNILL